MTTIEFTTSEILLANCCVLCVARIILYCTTLSWRGSSVNLCKIATPHPLTTVWRQTSEIHTFYFFMQLCTVTAQFSLKWQIVRHPKCCVQQIGQNQLRRNICHRYYYFGVITTCLFRTIFVGKKTELFWILSTLLQHKTIETKTVMMMILMKVDVKLQFCLQSW